MNTASATPAGGQGRISGVLWSFRLIWQTSRLLVIGMLLCTVIRGIVPAGFALAIRGLINSVTLLLGLETTDYSEQLMWLMLAFVVTVVDVLTSLFNQFLSERLRSDLSLEINSTVMKHAAGMDLPYMENAENREVLGRMRQNPGQRLHSLFSQGLGSVLSGLQVISLLVLLTWMEPWILLFTAILAVPFFMFQWRLARTRYMTEYNRTKKRRRTGYFLSRIISPHTVGEVKLLGIGGLLIDRFNATMEEFRDQDRRLQFRQFRGGAVFAVITSGAFYLLFGRVIYRVLQESLTIGDLAIFGGAVVRLRSALQSAIRNAARAYEQTLFVADFRSFLASEPDVRDSGGLEKVSVEGELSVENISFSYPGSNEIILKDLSLQVAPGETVAIVGENGGGKSTLAKLLVRLYDVDTGVIKLDGNPIGAYSLPWLHSHVAMLAQSFGKYEASVAENIAYADWDRLEHDRESIQSIASMTGLDHIAAGLPDGLDTELGREFSGLDLSGGQWQLLAITRILARNASVLILDEPTAHIDARSEHALFQAIEKLTQGVTTVIISHRFSTIRMANRIMVLHDGRIVEQGNHDELMSLNGRYKRLYSLHEHYRIAKS